MNCLYARAKSKFHLVLSADKCPSLFSDIDLTNITAIEYSPTASLEEDEWFFIVLGKPDPSEIPHELMISDPLERLHRQTRNTIDVIPKELYRNILYFVYQKSGSEWFIVEKVPNISKVYKKYVSFSEQPAIFEKPLVIINERADALYNTNTNTLYFKNLVGLEVIFNNINTLYREATKDEIEVCLQLSILTVDQNFNADKVTMPTSKLLASVLQIYNSHSEETKEQLHAYMAQIDLPKDEKGNFKIDDDKSLRAFIYALQERYYKTPATNEDRLAKSFIKR